MRSKYLLYALPVMILAWGQARSEETTASGSIPNAFVDAPPPADNAFGEAPCDTPGPQIPFIPQMIGGFFGERVAHYVAVPLFQTTVAQSTVNSSGTVTVLPAVVTTTQLPTQHVVLALDPVLSRGDFEISQNESPRPQDRVFGTYSFFDGVRGTAPFSPAFSVFGGSTSQLLPDGVTTVTTTSTISSPGVLEPVRKVNVHRETFGFEKAFCSGNASIGLRAPVFQEEGDSSFKADDFGDLSVIFKYAVINCAETGNVLSCGLELTAPTGPKIITPDGSNTDSFLVQPYIGYIFNQGGIFIQGFNSAAIPTDSKDVAVMFTDLGIGITAYLPDCQSLHFITPTLEIHVTTPLNHRSQLDVVRVPDSIDLTAGVHVGFGSHSLLTIGATTPVSGPAQFYVGGIAQLNFLF
jgi:hypothetical protein